MIHRNRFENSQLLIAGLVAPGCKNSTSSSSFWFKNTLTTLFLLLKVFLGLFGELEWIHFLDCFFVSGVSYRPHISFPLKILFKNSSLSTSKSSRNDDADASRQAWSSSDNIFETHRAQFFVT